MYFGMNSFKGILWGWMGKSQDAMGWDGMG